MTRPGIHGLQFEVPTCTYYNKVCFTIVLSLVKFKIKFIQIMLNCWSVHFWNSRTSDWDVCKDLDLYYISIISLYHMCVYIISHKCFIEDNSHNVFLWDLEVNHEEICCITTYCTGSITYESSNIVKKYRCEKLKT